LLLSWLPPGTNFTASGLPILHSNAAAPVAIYLDFQYQSRDGQLLLFNPSGLPETIDATEQAIIALAWAKAASSYAPFYVDVTTEMPPADKPFVWAAIYRLPTGPGSGGGARTFKYMDLAGYQANRYDPVTGRVEDGLLAQSWIREGAIYGDVITHETGHSQGIPGHETADEEGNPMGIQTLPIERGPFTRSTGVLGGWFNFTTEWTYQTNPAGMYYVVDDMKFISNAIIDGIKTYVDPAYTGDGYRPDDHAGTIAGATAMTWNASASTWVGDGIIERWSDTDTLSFDWSGGTAWVGARTAIPTPLLDVRMVVTDAAGNMVGASDPAESYQAALRLDSLTAGTYYISVASNGDYTELGEYELTVSTQPPAALMPISTLTFDGNSLTDSSGQGHNATVATGSSSWTTGRDGTSAARFTGSNRLQVYQSGNFTENGLNPLGRTFSFWFKADNVGAGGKQVLFEDAVAPGYQIYIENGRVKAYAINDEGLSDWRGGVYLDSGVSLTSGQWYHVALTHRTTFSEVDGTIALYLNGEEVARGAAGPVPKTDRFYIGSTSFTGAVDDVRIYSEVVPRFLIAEWAGRTDLSQPSPTGPAIAASATATHDAVQLSWSAAGGATGYNVLRSEDNRHFALVAAVAAGTLTYQDTSLRGSQQYFYRIAAQGASGVGAVEVTTRAGPVRFVQYTKVKNPDAEGDYTWASKADIWGHHCEGIYGIALNFFGPDGYRDTGLRIDESTDGVNFTTVVTLPPNESVYYDNGVLHNGLVHGQAYTYRLVPIDDLGPVDSAAVILSAGALNFIPVANPDTLAITTGDTGVINVLSNDSDWDKDPLTITSFTQGAFGTVTASGGSSLRYTRTLTSSTADTFTYTISDGFGATSTGTVTVTFASSGAIGIFPSGANIGSPAKSGSAGYAMGEYTIVAGGTDIWNTSDQFYYLHRPETGDVELIARVDSFDSVNDWGKAGIMFRNGTAANEAFAMVMVRPDDTVGFQWRTAAGASAGWNGSLQGAAGVVKYIRLVRQADTFKAYYSTNGTSWTQVGSTKTITMSSAIEVGLAVTSHDAGTLGTAHFSNVRFVPNAAPDAVNDSLSTGLNTALVIDIEQDLLANDTDADGDGLYLDSFTQPASGTVAANGNGTLTYVPNTGFAGNDSFTYTISDDNGGYDTATVALTVVAPDLPPTVDQPLDDVTVDWIAQDTVINLSGLFLDPAGLAVTLTVAGNTNPALVEASITGTDLTLSYAVFVSGSADITVRGTNSVGLYAEDTFKVTVNAIAGSTPPAITEVLPAGVGTNGILPPFDQIVLRFSHGVYSGDAVSPANYQLVAPGPDNVYDTPDDIAHVLAPAYNGLLDVTLTVADGVLPAGSYRLTVYGAVGRSIRDLSGLRLDGDGNGIEGGNHVSCFAVTWQGDANRDGVVDAADYITLNRNFGSAGGATWERGDFTGDGKTDYADLLWLMTNFGSSVSVVEAPPASGNIVPAGQGAETSEVVDIPPAADATYAVQPETAQPETAASNARQAAAVEPQVLAEQAAAVEPQVLAEQAAALNAATVVLPQASGRFDVFGSARLPDQPWAKACSPARPPRLSLPTPKRVGAAPAGPGLADLPLFRQDHWAALLAESAPVDQARHVPQMLDVLTTPSLRLLAEWEAAERL
jgi:hypothetical protein